jgi:hypothetical protein
VSGTLLGVEGEVHGEMGAKIGGGLLEAAGAVLGTVAAFIGIGDSDPNCDGTVLLRVLTFLPGELKPQSIGPALETTRSPSECGNDPHTTVVYGVRAFKHHLPPGVFSA